jgi:hypothetical protein
MIETFSKNILFQPPISKSATGRIRNGRTALPQLTKSFDEVNLPNFELLWIPQVIIAGGGSVAVTQSYKNCKIFGLTKMKLDKAG